MDYTIEREFFKAFDYGGIVDHCIDYILHKYSLQQTPEQYIKFYEDKLPQRILQEAAQFDKTIITSKYSSLMDEISANLSEGRTATQRAQYIMTSLIKPFQQLSDIYYPIALMQRTEKKIGQLDDSQEFAAKTLRGIIDNSKRVASKFHYLTNTIGEGLEWEKEDTVERCLYQFRQLANIYAHRLYGLLLSYHIDLRKMQKECGIYIVENIDIFLVQDYIGVELTHKLITELAQVSTSAEEDQIMTFPLKGNVEWFIKLHKFLIAQELIELNTKKEDFLFWFGFIDSDCPPNKIIWKGNKQLARELLEGIFKNQLKVAEIERLTPNCFSHKNICKDLVLAKNKPIPSMQTDCINEFLATYPTD